MARVPVYENQIGVSTPNVQTNTILATPRETFPLAQSQAMGNLGNSVSNAGNAITTFAIRKQKEDEEKDALKRQLDFKSQLNQALYSNENETIQDAQGNIITRPTGLMNRKLSQVKNSAIDFDKTFRSLYDNTMDGMTNYQQEILHPALLSSYESGRDAVVNHQATEEMKDYQQTFNSAVDQIVSDAASYDKPADVNNAISQAVNLVNTGMRRMGVNDKATIATKAMDVAGKIADNNISALLDKNPEKAQNVFDAIKDKLPNDTKEVLNAKINDKLFLMRRSAIWDTLSPEHRQSDGSYDMEAFRKEIDTLPNFTQQQKDKLYSYLEGRANDAEQNYKTKKAINYKNFLNDAITAKKSGQSYDDILKLAAKYSADPNEQQKMELDVKKLFDNTKTDPAVYAMLYQEMKTGELTQDRLNGFRNNISSADFKTFNDGLVDQVVNPQTNTAYKNAISTINVMLSKKFGSNKQKKDDFLTALFEQHEKTGGGSPEKLLQSAQELMKTVQVNPWPIIGRKPKFEVLAGQIKQDREFKAMLENEIGQDAVSAIGRGMMRSKGAKSFTAGDIKEFADKFGGYENIKPGTDAYNAIQFLIKNNRIVTPNTVQSVIDYFKKRQ